MTSKSSLAASAFVLALLATGTAKAQVPSTLAADFEVRIQRLERALSEMTGRYEEAGYEIKQLRDRIERMTGDLEFRLNALESGGAGGRGGGSRTAAPPPSAQERPTSSAQAGNLAAGKPPAGPASAAQAPLPNDPQKAYETAFSYLRDADYDKAEKALNEFLARNANHTLAGNAQYWLGETYFVRNKYPEAATAFATGIQKYPKGVKAPDNLLKFGMALGKLNKKTEACTALAQLPQKYPEASAGLKKKAESERRTLNCPGA
jgi:tol-pal system protein YbgF